MFELLKSGIHNRHKTVRKMSRMRRDHQTRILRGDYYLILSSVKRIFLCHFPYKPMFSVQNKTAHDGREGLLWALRDADKSVLTQREGATQLLLNRR